ncbi:energy transducer TonB [Bacteroidales bacterium AH-315-I05]|nr:energy transducer TonB [Bacteroidales bacterium AH-315-I05]
MNVKTSSTALLVALVLTIGVVAANHQIRKTNYRHTQVLSPDELPSFQGGQKALEKFIRKHLKYPSRAKEMGISGTVYVNFVVDVDGGIKNVKIATAIFPDLDEEAIRIMNLMPKWKPGKRQNKKVKFGLRLPVKFSLK